MSQPTLFAEPSDEPLASLRRDLADVSRADLEAEYLAMRRERLDLRRENEALRKGTPMRDQERMRSVTDGDARRAVRENEAAIADAFRLAGEACRRRWSGPGAVSFWREGQGSYRAAWTIPDQVRVQMPGATLVASLKALTERARGDAAQADAEGSES